MKLNEIINYRPPAREKTEKTTALRLMAGLLVVMVLCTLLSRAASAVTMPQVVAEKPIQASIAHTVEAQGVVSAIGETLVTTRDGVLVDSVAAGEGQTVAAGDILFTLNKESLAKKLRQEQTALQKLQLELTAQQLNDQMNAQQEDLTYERANEDYSKAFDRAYQPIEDANENRGKALDKMRRYYAEHKEVIDRGGALPPGVTSVDPEEWEILAQYRQLQAEYEASETGYDAAKDNRNDNWKSAERGMEDAKLLLQWDNDKQAEILGLSLTLQAESVQELQTLAEDGGAVRSPIDGVVSHMLAQPGGAVAGAAAMVANTDGGFRFMAEFTEDDMEYIEFGGAGTVSFPTGRPIKVTIDSVRGQTVTATLPEGTGEPDARGVLSLSHKGASQSTCVPMSALRSDGSQKYVMVLRETDTVLGLQLVAERVDVQLEDNNETRAAVSGALQNTDQVIVSTTKPVRAGDRVRLLE